MVAQEGDSRERVEQLVMKEVRWSWGQLMAAESGNAAEAQVAEWSRMWTSCGCYAAMEPALQAQFGQSMGRQLIWEILRHTAGSSSHRHGAEGLGRVRRRLHGSHLHA